MFCPNCGTENRETHRFCLRCGHPLISSGPEVRQAGRRWWLVVIVGLALSLMLGGGVLLLALSWPGLEEGKPTVLDQAHSPTLASTMIVTALLSPTFSNTPPAEVSSPSITPEPTATDPLITPPLPTAPRQSALPTQPPTSAPPTTATPPPTATPAARSPATPTADSIQQAIEDAIRRYCEIKAKATGPTHDDSQLATILAGEALKDQQKAVQWQRDNAAYYITTLHWMRFEWIQQVDATHTQVLVTKNETLLYFQGDWTTPSAKASCEACEYRVLYRLELMKGRWYIVKKEVQD